MNKIIRYLPLGDSYTIGEMVEEHERWPNILVENLKEKGINIELIENPAVTGYTTNDVIKKQLPILYQYKPDFSSLLIGVNDWVQGVSDIIFRNNLVYIIDNMLSILKTCNRIIIINIPDFSKTPEGHKYAKGRNITEGISHFNSIIKEVTDKKKLKMLNVFDISQKGEKDLTYITSDGLHPSGKQYKEWEKRIFEVAYNYLSV